MTPLFWSGSDDDSDVTPGAYVPRDETAPLKRDRTLGPRAVEVERLFIGVGLFLAGVLLVYLGGHAFHS